MGQHAIHALLTDQAVTVTQQAQPAFRAARAATEPFDRDRVLGAYASAYRALAEENLA